jgi:hypothetical protein
MGKTEVGLAFNGGSNQSVITKEYAERKKLKKVGFKVPVIGFSSPEPEMGELYEVPLRANGKREVIIRAVAVETIHDGPAAKCPDKIATRFLQSRNAKSWDLDQVGGGDRHLPGHGLPLPPAETPGEGVQRRPAAPLHIGIRQRPHPVRGGAA